MAQTPEQAAIDRFAEDLESDKITPASFAEPEACPDLCQESLERLYRCISDSLPSIVIAAEGGLSERGGIGGSGSRFNEGRRFVQDLQVEFTPCGRFDGSRTWQILGSCVERVITLPAMEELCRDEYQLWYHRVKDWFDLRRESGLVRARPGDVVRLLGYFGSETTLPKAA
jgi:hypothetical protein